MKRIALVALLLILVLCACSKKEPDPTPTPEPTPEIVTPSPTPTPTPTPEPTPEPVDYGNMNPLNGLPLDDAHLKRRPVAVMFNNLKAALPLMGITKADLIYEALAEGGITRIVGFFKNTSEVPTIGTVRSTRAYYLDIAQGHDAILMHVGGSAEALNLISSRGMYTLDGLRNYPFYYRDQARVKSAGLEHSMMAKGDVIDSYIAEQKSARILYEDDYDPYSMTFADTATPEGDTAAKVVSITFSSYKTGVFEFNEEDKLYYVSQYGKPLTDGEDSAQLTVKNVLVLYANVSQIPGDTAGRLKTELVGSGEGTFICDGKAEAITWSKRSVNDPFVYTQANGEQLKLAAGVSYINIVPTTAKITLE